MRRMTRALLVERDPPVAERIAAALRLAGYDVTRCAGPSEVTCPIVGGSGCALVEHADVLVYDVADARTTVDGASLVEELREVYADHPVVLIGDGGQPRSVAADVLTAESGITHLGTAPDVATLAFAVEDALAEH
jgi:DNA-binding NtrC family response regulator